MFAKNQATMMFAKNQASFLKKWRKRISILLIIALFIPLISAGSVETSGHTRNTSLKTAGESEVYHAYLGFQTNTYSFRNTWNDATYGIDSRYLNYDSEIGYWSGPALYVHDITATDPVLTADQSEYLARISGINLRTLKGTNATDRAATAFNMIFISTDIPRSMTGIEMKNATLSIDGTVVREYDVVPCKGDASVYYQFMLADTYAPDDMTQDVYYDKNNLLRILPTNSITVNFQIDGLGGDSLPSSPTVAPVVTRAPSHSVMPNTTSAPTRTPWSIRTSAPTRTPLSFRTSAPTRTPASAGTSTPTRTPVSGSLTTSTRTPVPTRTPVSAATTSSGNSGTNTSADNEDQFDGTVSYANAMKYGKKILDPFCWVDGEALCDRGRKKVELYLDSIYSYTDPKYKYTLYRSDQKNGTYKKVKEGERKSRNTIADTKGLKPNHKYWYIVTFKTLKGNKEYISNPVYAYTLPLWGPYYKRFRGEDTVIWKKQKNVDGYYVVEDYSREGYNIFGGYVQKFYTDVNHIKNKNKCRYEYLDSEYFDVRIYCYKKIDGYYYLSTGDICKSHYAMESILEKT